MIAVIEKTNAQSQRRFFVMMRHFSDKELTFFLNVDFKNHVAIVAVAEGGKVIVGGGRYIVFEPGRPEMACLSGKPQHQ